MEMAQKAQNAANQKLGIEAPAAVVPVRQESPEEIKFEIASKFIFFFGEAPMRRLLLTFCFVI